MSSMASRCIRAYELPWPYQAVALRSPPSPPSSLRNSIREWKMTRKNTKITLFGSDKPLAGAPSSWGSLCPREGCGKPMGPNGLHHLTCLESGKGGAKGMRAYRHANVNRALRAAMRRLFCLA